MDTSSFEGADVVKWSAVNDVRVVVLFICGNPGLVNYYSLFLSTISSSLPSAAVYGIGHLNHSTSIKAGDKVATLRDQVDHKIRFVDQLDQQYKFRESQTKLVLIAHSIGSWISLEVLKSRPHVVASLHFLFPTISHMQSSDNGRRLTPLFSPYLNLPLHLTTTALSFVPSFFLRPLVGLFTQQPPSSAMVTSSLVTSPSVVAAAISMAREEMTQVTKLDHDVLKLYGDRMRFYWAQKDGWVLESSIVEIEAVLEGSGYKEARRIRCEEGMLHAFCIVDDHAESLASKCVEWIKEDLL